jgi:hypothetical protein
MKSLDHVKLTAERGAGSTLRPNLGGERFLKSRSGNSQKSQNESPSYLRSTSVQREREEQLRKLYFRKNRNSMGGGIRQSS